MWQGAKAACNRDGWKKARYMAVPVKSNVKKKKKEESGLERKISPAV